jgi:two-component system, sensor histidine kinase and response regulator
MNHALRAARARGGPRLPRSPEAPGDAVDWTAALEAVQGDHQLLEELIEIFLDECPRLVGQAGAAIAAGDADKLQRTVHTIQGSLRLFGAARACELCCGLEKSMARQADLRPAAPMLAALTADLEQVSAALRAFVGSPQQKGTAPTTLASKP